MARCFVYDRFLDAKTLPEFEHVFEFNTIVKIKEEVEHDPLDTETGQSVETSAAETVGVYGDPDLELHSTIVPEQQPEESRVAPCPKIVIKFRDLWGNPDESRDPPEKRKKRRHTEIANEIPNQYDTRQRKRRKTDLKVALKNHSTRSSTSKSKVSQSNEGKQNEKSIVSREEVDSETVQMHDIWNLTRITHLENNSQILCECCGRSFPTLRHLEAHIRYYTADGIFQCVICNRKFNRNSQLKRHIKAMHTDQPNKHIYKYKCQICHDRFKQKPGLIAHVTHLHHQRILLQRKGGNWIKRKSKSLTGDAETIEDRVSVKEEKFSDELNPEDDASLATGNSFDNLNNENEQFIPASLRVEQEKNVCLDNEISGGFKDPEEVSIKVECDEETIVGDEIDLRGQMSKKDKAIERLQEDTTQRNQPQRGNQVCLEIVSGNLQPQLRGNLIDHLGNTVGNWCVSESFDQPKGADRFNCSNSTSVEVSSTVRNRKIGSVSTSSGSKTGTLKSISTNPADEKAIDNVARLALARNERGTNTREKLLPLDKVIDEQIGIVLSSNVLEKIKAAKANVTNIAGSGLSKINNSGEMSSVRSEKANAVSSKNIPLKNSSTFNAQDVVTLKSFNASSKFKVKDVRVSLVKLEDMLNLSKEPGNPVEAKKFYCIICDKDFSSKRGLKRHCTKKHETGNKSSEASELATEKTKSIDEYSSEALTKNSEPEEQGNSGTASAPEKQCHLCNEVFRNTFSIVSHYITVHTDAGVLRCCLCNEDEKTSRKLRFHLYKHFNNRYAKNVPKSCVSCAKELNIFSLTPCCLDCKEQLKSRKKDLCKRRVARVQVKKEVTEKKYVSLRKKFLPSFLKDTIVSGTSATDNQVAKNDRKIDTKIVKNFKCLACNRVFLESGRLKHHLLTAHVDVEYSKRETRRSVKSKTDHKNIRPKLKVGLNKNIKCKVTSMRDKSCQKKLRMRGRSKLFGINGKKEQSSRQLHFQNDLKTCYNRKCNVCGLNCCCRTCLKIHKKRYSSDGNNICNKCGLKFAQKHLLAVHSKRAHNSIPIFNGKFKCQICTQGFYNKKFLRIHLAHFHNMKYLNCKTCGIRFNSFRELNNHRQYYSEIVSYLCSTCGQIFKCKFMLEYHNAQVHDYGELLMYKYSCDVCHCAFLDELLLRAHVGHFHKEKNQQSEKNVLIENFGQVGEQNLENTEVRVKTENDFLYSTLQNDALDETGKAVQPPSEYKCSLCKLSFTDPYAILNHEWEYSNDGKYACDLCNRRFMTNFHLKNHKIKHYQRNAIRKYECYVCKEDFLRKNDLVMHGLHLHGPQFISGKNAKAADSSNLSKLNYPVTQDRESILEKSSISNTYDSIGLLTSNNDSYNGKVLLFQKMSNNRSTMELLRRHSNEDSYCCEFCQTNFSSASLLKDHTKKHAYHAYYTNLSRYLCLICKNKFRTNDILRAHVVYFHTSDSKKSTSGKPSPADQSIQFETMNINESLPLKHSIPDSTSFSKEECSSICQPNITSLEQKEQVVHRVDNMNVPQARRVRRTYSARKIKNQINNNSECNDTNGNEDRNLGRSNSRRKRRTKRGELEKTSEAIKLFTIKAENADEPRKYTCIICIQTFDSVTHFGEHFANVHFRDQAYICALCNEKFVYMSHLKQHISKHEEDPKRYVCCDKIFSEITDLMYHKKSHAKQDAKNQRDPNEDLPLSVRVASFQKTNDAINIQGSVNMCKCEICDAAFSDFRTLLKHWDSCINKNCLQCDFCGARFKGKRFLEVHKLSCNYNKQNSDILEKRWSTTSQNNMSGGRIIIDNSLSVNPNPFKEERRCYGPANKLSTQNKSSSVKQNTKYKEEYHFNEKQEINTNVSKTKLRSNKATVSSNRLNVTASVLKKMLIENFEKRVSLNINSSKHTPLVNKSNKQISSEISHESDDNHLSSDLSNHHISERSILRNNFNLRKKRRKRSPSLNTVKDSSSIKPAIRNSTCVKDTKVESGQKFRKNNVKDTESSNPKPQSTITAESQDYYESVQYFDDRFNNILDTSLTPSGSDKTPHSNEHHTNNRLSDLPALPSNSDDRPAYYLCIEPSSDDSDENSDETLFPNDPNLKSRRNDIHNKQLLRYLQKSSSAFTNSIRDVAAQKITDNSIKNSNKNIQSNNAAPQLNTNVNKNKKVPVPPSLTQNSTHAASRVSHKNATQDIDSPSDDCASDKEPEPVVTNRNFRCSYCFAWFSEREQLTKHLEAHKTARQCPACGIVFSNENALRQHLPEHECSVCTRCTMAVFFKDAQAYHEGTRKHCPLCKSLLPVPSRKSNHSPANSEQQVMKCGVCMEAFDSMSKLSAHFRLVHLSFVCLICQARFSTKYTLRNHLHTHDKKTTSVTSGCKVCKNNFAEEVNLEDDPSSDGTVQADE